MTSKSFVALLVATALAWVLPAGAQNLPIRIGASPASDHAAVFVGVEKGIFARHGLDAKVELYPTGVEMINGLLNGANDVNVMASVPFLSGIAHGQPLVLIGHNQGDPLKTSYQAYASIVGLTSAGLKEGDVKALAGKKIGLPRGTSAESYVLGVLAQNGLKATDVTLVNITPSNVVSALRQGDVQAISIWEPMASAAALKVPNAVRVISGGCEGCYDPGTLLTTKDNVTAKAETLRRFLLAYAEAHQWVRQHLDETAEIDTRWIPGVDLDVMKVAVRHAIFDERMSKQTLVGLKTKTIPTLVADKRLPAGLDPTPFIDPQFVQYAQKTGPQYFSDLPPIPPALQF
ncbi:MAG TPA: ABC transporter substrate-binding protein [Casimicrobiaceae bacterium]|nr:ABC transporter substrate-binding protein [Casimicrobiaceae bacterium]